MWCTTEDPKEPEYLNRIKRERDARAKLKKPKPIKLADEKSFEEELMDELRALKEQIHGQEGVLTAVDDFVQRNNITDPAEIELIRAKALEFYNQRFR